MVAKNAEEAVKNSRKYKTCRVGMCLMYSRTWLEIGSGAPTASSAWAHAAYKHPGDRSVPKGAPMFWTGGSRGFGHIAICVSPGDNPTIRSTDIPYAGVVGEAQLSWFDSHWTNLRYAGWAESLNGMVIPWLHSKETGSKYDHGDVYVEKLHEGQKNSDSVGRLTYRLTHMKAMQGTGHKPVKMYLNYNQDVVEAVRYWQRNVAKKHTKGPTDGTKMSNDQAKELFGDNYTVHPK